MAPTKFNRKVKPSPELIKKYSKGPEARLQGVKTSVHKLRLEKGRRNTSLRSSKPQEQRHLEADPGETTTQFTQKQIVKAVDIAAATKSFDLRLDLVPIEQNTPETVDTW
ncbi:hypothetical protein NQ318_010917 [Aromia moschata]|uniref:Uncharacterized protein n=1 Tax=Aromia moschata TaxID=1265417 RepID=A0AAV8XE30_9CUCU|nr:hypothetical protein NQ318_010917 [Aromia moschata]